MSLGRNAVSIYQDLVEAHGFSHRYNSVKRFVAALRTRTPERFDVLEFLPGEEAKSFRKTATYLTALAMMLLVTALSYFIGQGTGLKLFRGGVKPKR